MLKARSPAESMQDRASAISAGGVSETGVDAGAATRAITTASLTQKPKGTLHVCMRVSVYRVC